MRYIHVTLVLRKAILRICQDRNQLVSLILIINLVSIIWRAQVEANNFILAIYRVVAWKVRMECQLKFWVIDDYSMRDILDSRTGHWQVGRSSKGRTIANWAN